MSEYTDYFAYLSNAADLSAVHAEVDSVLDAATISPLVGFRGPWRESFTQDLLNAYGRNVVAPAYAALEKPTWVVLTAQASTLDEIAALGPALHFHAHEDHRQWRVEVVCDGQRWIYLMAHEDWSDWWPSGNHTAALAAGINGIGPGSDALAACLNVTTQDLMATFQRDGGVSFADAVGFEYWEMLDQNLFTPPPGVIFDYMMAD